MSGHGGFREGNPTYRLTPVERSHLAMLAQMNLWTKTELAQAFGVSRRTVNDCLARSGQ